MPQRCCRQPECRLVSGTCLVIAAKPEPRSPTESTALGTEELENGKDAAVLVR